MSKPRLVFDTNTLVSAVLIKQSVPRQAFDLALEQGVILMSLPVLEELNAVLSRPKFNRYITETERIRFLVALLREAEMIAGHAQITACRDASDNKFLELGVDGRADYIVSGDADLLVLHPFRGIAILTPRAFLESFPHK